MGVKRIAFVGGFSRGADGTVGGQVSACRSLLEATDSVSWFLIDTTMRSLPPPPFVVRVFDSAIRFVKLVGALLWWRAEVVFIFSSFSRTSIAEKGLFCLFARLCRRRVVLFFRSEIAPGRVKYLERFTRAVVSACDVVLCQTESARDAVIREYGVREGACRIVRNWIDVTKYQPIAVAPRATQIPAFLYLGWLEPFKGVRELIDAAALVAASGIGFRLVVCGSGSLEQQLRERAAQLALRDRVSFRGWVGPDEKMAELSQSDILVLPSYSEGSPNAVLEAMAAGRAIIGTAIPGISALVREGYGGILVQPRDVVQLADAMIQLAKDPAKARSMGVYNATEAIAHYDVRPAWQLISAALGIEAVEDGALRTVTHTV